MRRTLSREVVLPARARVDVAIDLSERRIRIRDNGPGLSREEARERLVAIGRSNKTLGIDRGFRGVGRLAGTCLCKDGLIHHARPRGSGCYPNHMV